MTTTAVTVGFDDSKGSWQAALWAAEEASIRACPLIIMRTFAIPYASIAYGWHTTSQFGDARQEEAARQSVDAVVAQVRSSHPDLDASASVVQGSPADSLLTVARQADAGMIVVGSSGHSAIPRILLGSTAAELVRATDRPVVVVRGTTPDDARSGVLAGLDGSRADRRVLGAAFEYAAYRGTTVQAVHSTPSGPLVDAMESLAASDGPSLSAPASATELAEKYIDEWHSQFPEVPVDFHVVDELPAQALLERSEEACLVVVGSRQHGPVRRAVLGSVSHAMLYHADCPVEVVPEELRVGKDRHEPDSFGRGL